MSRSSKLSAPDRFISLHSHDGFSTFDGLGYPQEHIDFVIENGMDGWCLTNHGHMNSFGHAFVHAEKILKRGGNFKLRHIGHSTPAEFCASVDRLLVPCNVSGA